MKYAPIAPPHLLDIIDAAGSRYHMALGQWLTKNGSYRAFYRQQIRMGGTVIVDNGAAEPENERVSYNLIVLDALDISADMIVLPDVLLDAEATMAACKEHADLIDIIPPSRRLFIPQGKDLSEWISCLDWGIKNIRFGTVGVPKHLERFDGARQKAVEAIVQRGAFRIHMFGIYGNARNEIRSLGSVSEHIMGIDSGIAIAASQRNVDVDRVVSRYSLDDCLGVASKEQAVRNIHLVSVWCATGG